MIEDPEYLAGLRAASSAALEFGFVGIERGDEGSGAVPEVLLEQARQAACNGVDLDIVMRRCFAGYALLGDFVFQAVEDLVLTPRELRLFWGSQAVMLDRLVSAMAEAYKSEAAKRLSTLGQRQAERVKKLLAGQLMDSRNLDYEFDAWHIGVVAVGPGASVALRELAEVLDRRLLLVTPEGEMVWAWLGGHKKVSGEQLLHLSAGKCPTDVSLSLGEPARGLRGWRRTHRQAKAAIPVALNRPPSVVRYIDFALLASALRDDLLADSLTTAYLDPLAEERDGGAGLRLTLRAYFAAGRNVSSASAALKVSRQTVNNRLRTIEARIGRSIGTCAAEMETALRLRDLRPATHPPESRTS